MISESDGKELLAIARETVSAALEGRQPTISRQLMERFSEKQGAYVAIYRNGELRGNIGYAEPVYPLLQAVVRAAFAAAFRDPRFLPLTKDEFYRIVFEVSVLSMPEQLFFEKPAELIKKINAKTDGLMIRFGPYTGMLLPQEAVKNKWSAEEFLDKTCEKGGLPPECWQDKHAKVYRFQAQVFSEEKVTKYA